MRSRAIVGIDYGVVDRKSNKHNPRLDEELSHEVRSLTQGAPVESRSRADRLKEGPIPGPANRPTLPGEVEDLTEVRSLIATSLRPSAFPGRRDDLLAVASEEFAPDEVMALLQLLPGATVWDTFEQVWEALGGQTEARATGEPVSVDVDDSVVPPPTPPEAPSLVATGLAALRAVPIEVVVPGLAVVDAVRSSSGAWAYIGESRTAWIKQIVLRPVVGPWKYATEIKPRLRAAATWS